ncbi:amidohydrolase [Robertkochia aurantiaca]|uniref:amidohydrolase n=1 Tax=Robertkochia aurantiaca TaxID=2873700 RepID=UPI001CCB7CCE|nr:amidohydrolase [Robertkochia sp. 3YJGBD-33]
MKLFWSFFIGLLLVSYSCKKAMSTSANNGSGAGTATLYHGGDIITMEGEEPQYAEVLITYRDTIAYVGSEESVPDEFENATRVDLQGQTLLPGFIDGHAHFSNFGTQAVVANLLAEPDGSVNTIDDLITTLKKWHEENGTDKTNGWIIGMGYDDAVLKEGRHPTREDLDKVSGEIPVMATHISGHFCAVNSKGLEIIGYDASSKNPEGGVIRRMAQSEEPNGVLEELAAIPAMIVALSPKEQNWVDYYLDKGQEMAFSYGYTTAQDGRSMQNHEQLADYADRGKLKLDVVSYIDYAFPQYMRSEWNSDKYKNHYRIGGVKLTLDGSPQGRTAWRTEPYILPPDGQQQGYKGYPAIPEDEKVQAIVDSAFANNWQLLAHTNGDAALDQLIRAVRASGGKYGNDDRRTVMIHGQLVRMDQLDSLKKYDMVASFFPMHTFYWGDWYKEIIGPEKAQQISPIRSAIEKGVPVTSHTDAPVALPNLMMVMHTTVNRVSRSGDVIGADESLTPYQALKAITAWSAWQHFEEERKGTLTKGKLADLVILDNNPLKVEPMALKDIKVIETIKEGETVYRRDGRIAMIP